MTEAGERLDLGWRFWPGRPRYAVALAAPLPGARLDLEGAVERQPFTMGLPASQRAGARGTISMWATGRVRVEARAGADRWEGGPDAALTGGALRVVFDRAIVDAGADVWFSRSTFSAGRLLAAWRSSPGTRGTVVLVRGGRDAVRGNAPLDLWPAVDTGQVRGLLARAHPLLDGARLRADRLGRDVWSASAGVQRWFGAGSLVRVAAAAFADAARTDGGAAPGLETIRRDLDLGLGVRVAVAGLPGVLRLDAAHGCADARNAVSVVWSADAWVP
jgi:hypothetical protein